MDVYGTYSQTVEEMLEHKVDMLSNLFERCIRHPLFYPTTGIHISSENEQQSTNVKNVLSSYRYYFMASHKKRIQCLLQNFGHFQFYISLYISLNFLFILFLFRPKVMKTKLHLRHIEPGPVQTLVSSCFNISIEINTVPGETNTDKRDNSVPTP